MSNKNNTPEKVNSNVFDLLKGIGKSEKKTIYKPIFDGLTDKQKKAFRKKLRSKRDDIIEAFNNAPKAEKKNIASAWQKFAEKVYIDTNVIFDANTSEDKLSYICEFVVNVKKVLNEN